MVSDNLLIYQTDVCEQRGTKSKIKHSHKEDQEINDGWMSVLLLREVSLILVLQIDYKNKFQRDCNKFPALSLTESKVVDLFSVQGMAENITQLKL